jgi:hypothetical protein
MAAAKLLESGGTFNILSSEAPDEASDAPPPEIDADAKLV